MIQKLSEAYCESLLSSFGSKVLVNMVLSLASNTSARSVTELTESVFFQYQFSSFSQELLRLSQGSPKRVSELLAKFRRFVLSWQSKLPDISENMVVRCALDGVNLHKLHSHTFSYRTYFYDPSPIQDIGKRLSVGCPTSYLSIGFCRNLSIPCNIHRVSEGENMISLGITQLAHLLEDESIKDKLLVSVQDRGYDSVSFFGGTKEHKKLVTITRLKSRNVYTHSPKTQTGGANQVYGQGYHLMRKGATSNYKNPKTKEVVTGLPSIDDLDCSEELSYDQTNWKGKKVKMVVKVHKNMLLRSSGNYKMKNIFFNLVVIDTLDIETQQPLHKRPIYLAVFGQEKDQIAPIDVYQTHYKHRFDLEHNVRFAKRTLFLEKFQTCHLTHLDLFLGITTLAQTLLLLVATEITPETVVTKKWHKNPYNKDNNNTTNDLIVAQNDGVDSKANKRNAVKISLAEAQRSAHILFSTFDLSRYAPRSSKKGKGRLRGATLTPKQRYTVVKKGKKMTQKQANDSPTADKKALKTDKIQT